MSIAVIIAAHNAAKSIGKAVASALRQPEVAEVVVADDASCDGTSNVVRTLDDDTGRLRILRLETNRGPSAARNMAIAESRAPLIAILDADDILLPNRFERLLAATDWDFIADNICFVSDDARCSFSPASLPEFPAASQTLTLARFVESNISRPGHPRAELGFLKPLIRREFLDANKLRYDETMRFAEDYDLYLRALAAGACFKTIGSCGYLATERADSLSSGHGADDLRRVVAADTAVLATGALTDAERKAVTAHRRHVQHKYHLRHFLDRKQEDGLFAAVKDLVAAPDRAPGVIAGVARDKFAPFLDHGRKAATTRFLLDPQLR